MSNLWIVVNIGCIECGVSSNIVGVFDDEAVAGAHTTRLNNTHSWRERGQNYFEAFPMPTINVVNEEYVEND